MIPDSWSISRGPDNTVPFACFHLRGKIFGKEQHNPSYKLWLGKFALTVKLAVFSRPCFVNALIVLLGLKIQLAITSPTCH